MQSMQTVWLDWMIRTRIDSVCLVPKVGIAPCAKCANVINTSRHTHAAAEESLHAGGALTAVTMCFGNNQLIPLVTQ